MPGRVIARRTQCPASHRLALSPGFMHVLDYIFTSVSAFFVIGEILVFKLKTVLRLLG